MTTRELATNLAFEMYTEAICTLFEQGVTNVTDDLVEETLDLFGQGLSMESAARLVRVDWQNGLIN